MMSAASTSGLARAMRRQSRTRLRLLSVTLATISMRYEYLCQEKIVTRERAREREREGVVWCAVADSECCRTWRSSTMIVIRRRRSMDALHCATQ